MTSRHETTAEFGTGDSKAASSSGYNLSSSPALETSASTSSFELGKDSLTGGLSAERDTSARQPDHSRPKGCIDQCLLRRSMELVESALPSQPEDLDLAMTSLREEVGRMWESAVDASRQHQAVLSILDRAIIVDNQIDDPRDYLSAVREALIDLAQPNLTEAHVETIQARFVDLGVGSLALLSGADLSDEPDE